LCETPSGPESGATAGTLIRLRALKELVALFLAKSSSVTVTNESLL